LLDLEKRNLPGLAVDLRQREQEFGPRLTG
jgi:hypothetical protein